MGKREFTVPGEHLYDRRGPVRWVASHVARYPIFPIMGLLAAILNNFLYSSIQLIVGRGFDLISSPSWRVAALGRLGLLLAGVAAGQGLTGLARNWAAEFIAQRIERDGRDELYISLLGKSQTFHGRQRIGDIMARVTNDVHLLNLLFSPGLNLIIDSLFAIVAPMIFIAQIHVQLLLVPAIFLVLLAVTIWDYNRRLNPVTTAMRDQFGTMNAGLAEAVAGIEVVKANVQERSEWYKFTQNARVFRDHYVKQGEVQALYWPALAFSLAWGAAFLHALLTWRAGSISLGDAVAFIGLVGTLRYPTFMSLWTFDLVQLAVAGTRRILDILNTETDLDENTRGAARRIRGEVVFDHVSFGYNGKTVLKDLSFEARPGETVAIVGQTGSGKSTLTRLVNRIFDPDDGRVLIDGVEARAWSLGSLRSQISVIEQDVFLFSRTIAENIAFGCADATQEAIEQAARAAQAHDFITSFRDGYQTEIGERGVTLSGGQRQRIAIARAFLTDPRILILDDSTSAIDSATEDQIQRAMRLISSERTTFLITHRLSQIRWASHILVLHGGQLIDQGTHEELLARSPDYQRIFARYE